MDRGKDDSDEHLQNNGDLNGGSGLLVEPRERKKGEVRMMMFYQQRYSTLQHDDKL